MKQKFKNAAKKITRCVLLSAIILTTLFQTGLKTAQAGTSLNALMNQYVGTKWNGEYYGKQCKGFANYMFYRLWGVKFIGVYNSSKYYIPNPSGSYEVGRLDFNNMSLQNAKNLLSQGLPGDFIQVRRRNKTNGHSMILVSRDSGGITVFDCNSDGKNSVKRYYINWQSFYNKNSAMSLYRANNNTGNAPANNTPSNNNSALPSITNVGIDSIDSSHITFHFTANNAGLARILIESRNTGQSVTYDYTSGLNHVSHTFYTDTLPGTTEMYVRLYAYSTTNGGNETLHNMLYGSIPGVVQIPQDTLSDIEELCFDYIYYADHNTDIRNAFGYDKAKLLNHWRKWGIAEGRVSSPIWDPMYYLSINGDVAAVYGKDYTLALKHFINWGYKENRISSHYYNGNYYKNRYYGEFKDMDSEALLKHFKNWGLKEQRFANTARYTGNSSWK